MGLVGLALASCWGGADAPNVVKIGVIAPFEGIGRPLGYAVLPRIKDELASANGAMLAKHYRVSVVALNDDLDPTEAADQARALARDPEVVAAIGLWSEATARASGPILRDAGIPTLFATSGLASGPMDFFLCPIDDRVAADLVQGAQASDGLPIIVTGPDNPLRKAILAQSPGLLLVPESASHPCRETAGASCSVIHSGDAVGAAESLRRWRAAGWDGAFLGGPEVARPWFIGQAGKSAEGARAVTCGASRQEPGGDAALQASADAAGAATRSILSALDQAMSTSGRLTRASISNALVSSAPEPGLTWIEVRNQGWVALHE